MSDRISIQEAVKEDKLEEYVYDLSEPKGHTLLNFINDGQIDPGKDVKEEMRQWVKNLKSGKFDQGDKELVTEDNKYCCLGVAGETCKINTSLMQKVCYPEEVGGTRETPLWRFLKLNSTQSMALAVANDQGFSFEEIAELIKWKYNL